MYSNGFQFISMPKNNAFNALRLFFCLIVIFEHIVVLTQINLPLFNIRSLAVDVFFIFSGFWVTRSFLNSGSIKEYAFKRFRKILPQYFLVVILVAFLFCFISSLAVKDYFFSSGFIKYLISNLLFMNFLSPSLPGVFQGNPVNGSLWTIKIEIAFYFFLPLILFLLEKLRTKKIGNLFLCSLYVFSALWTFFVPFLAMKFQLPAELANQFPSFLAFFVSGILYLYNCDFFQKYSNVLVLPAGVLILLHFLTGTSFFLPIALTVFVFWLAFKLTWFQNIGKKFDFSYSMYLFHFPVIQVINNFHMFSENVFIGGLCVFGVTFLLAYIVNTCFQKYF